jgi:hypothetical protein
MIHSSDTRIRRAESDTTHSGVSSGERVRISAGLLDGLETTVIHQSSNGRVLLQLQQGVYIEIYQYCLEKIKEV